VGLFDSLLQPIVDLFNRIFAGTVVGKLVNKIIQGISHISTLVTRIENLISSIKDEISAFANWKEMVHFKSRVINIPKAVEQARDLVGEVIDAWHAILSLVNDIKEKLSGAENATEEAEEMASDFEEVGIGESLLKKLPKLSKGFEKLLGVVTLIVDSVISWSDAVDKLQDIVNAVSDLRDAIESGDTIFLSQKNGRREVPLAQGGAIKIRVGGLHS